MRRGEVLRRRVEWCAALAASLPPGTVRTALDDLVRKHLLDLGALQQREASRNALSGECVQQSNCHNEGREFHRTSKRASQPETYNSPGLFVGERAE